MNLALVLFLGGIVTITWIYFWARQREEDAGFDSPLSEFSQTLPSVMKGDAVLVAQEYGKLVYINDPARKMLDLNGGTPNLEHIARMAEPTNNFLNLFAGEGQSSFLLGQRWMEGSSHRIPAGPDMRTVVVLRELASNTSNPDMLDMGAAMSIINEIGDTVNVALGLDSALQTVLSIVSKHIQFDAAEISLWNEGDQVLYQRGWAGSDTLYLLALAEAGGYYEVGEGITGYIAGSRQPLLLITPEDLASIPPKLQSDYRSFVGVPISLGERFIGTMELASRLSNAFKPGDMALLQAVTKSVAVTIYNADMYAQQSQRINDIAMFQRAVDLGQVSKEGVERIYGALNTRLAELIDADMCGILLMDAERGGLVMQTPVYGLPDALVRSIFIPLVPNSPQHDIWTHQQYWVSNDVGDEPLVEALGLSPVVSLAGIANTAWFPLQLGAERIGALAVSNKRTEGGFSNNDIQNLLILAAQVSIAIENIRLFEREQRMDAELAGLQEITNAIGSLSHETEFYGEITERIANLMAIEMVGIMLYDEAGQRLVSQPPFFGIPTELIENYTVPLPSNSVMRELWEDERYWYSNRVSADALVYAAGLDELAATVGVTKTMFGMMQASGRRLGVVQVSNKRNGEDFTESDARLLLIFATQAAAIIENARLFREAQRSAEQAQSLRRVAELAGNVLSSQESFAPVLAEVAELMDAENVYVNVLDTQRASLVTYPRWVFGYDLAEPIIQDIYSPGFEKSVVSSQKPFVSNDLMNDSRILPGYARIATGLKLRNTILVPLIFGDRQLGELGVANREGRPFEREDLEIMQVVAAQIASALDRLLLYEATGENLSRRINELDAVSRVSNELTLTLDLVRILSVIREESISATGATDCSIVLVDTSGDHPRQRQRIGLQDRLNRVAPIEREAIESQSAPVNVSDFEFSTMDPVLSDARSALAVPILYLDQVAGVIHLYKDQPNHFDDRATAFVMTMAAKASLGYGNAIRYQEQVERSENLRSRVDQLNRIFELGHMFQTNTDPVAILEAIAYSVQQSVGFDTVVMLLFDESSNNFARVAQAGLPLEAFEESQRDVISMTALDTLFHPDYRISESYFFPVEKLNDWYSPSVQALSTDYDGKRTIDVSGHEGWHSGDLFVVRMTGPSGNIIGLMSLDRPHNNKRPERGTVEVLEIFANQAASTIENTRLYLASLSSAEQEAQLNEIMESVSSTLEIEEIVRSVASGTFRMMPFSRMTLILRHPEDQTFDALTVRVTPDHGFDIQRESRPTLAGTALNRTLSEGHDFLYLAGDADINAYDDLREWQAQGERATLILPLLTGGEVLGVVHIGSDSESSFGMREFRPLFRRMAQLVASSVQNARLFDQAVNLQILNESVVESIQQGIIVLDNTGKVISVNGFLAERFGWSRDIVGKNFVEYSGEVGEVLQEALNIVLSTGAPQDVVNQTMETVGGTMSTVNFYVYPLRFGLTVRGAVLLVEDVTQRALLEQAMEARANQLAALTDVSTRITSSLERDEVAQLALEEMGWLIPHTAMTLWRRNGSYMVLEGATGMDGDSAHEKNLRFLFSDYDDLRHVVDSQRVVAGSSMIVLPEGSQDIHEKFQSWMGVPLVNQGHVVGMMILTDTEADSYESKSDQNIAFAFASQVAIALANADLFEQTFDRTNELGTLLEAAQATSLTTDLDSLFRTVVELMFSALEMDSCAILIWDEVDNQLEVQLDLNRTNDPTRMMPQGTRYDLDAYPARLRALRDREVVVILHTLDDTPYPKEVEELEKAGDAARMLVPLVVRESSRGLIQLGTQSSEVITQQKVRLARALGAQVAVAIENARLSAETTAHFEESLIINDLSRAISSTLNLEDMFSVVRDQMPSVTGASELYLALYDDSRQTITFPLAVRHGENYDIPPRELGTDEVSFIIRQRRPLNLGADYYSPDELRHSLGITNSEGNAKSYLGVPLIAGDEVYGVLAVRDTERTRAFTINEQRILTTVGSQLGAAIQNARLFRQIRSFADDLNREVADRTRELEDERDRIDTLYQITSELARTLDMDRLMPRALGMVAKAVGASDGVIMQLDPITDQLYSRAVLNPNSLYDNPTGERPLHPAERIARWIIMEDEHVLLINDLHEEEYWEPDLPEFAIWHSGLAVLLETNEELLGVMVFLGEDIGAFHEAHVRLMVAAANQVASSINNAELYKMIREQAERLGSLLRAEQEEADKNKAILEGIADGVVLVDTHGQILLFNNAAERIFRLPRIDVLGKPFASIVGVHGSSAQIWADALEQRLINPDQDLTEFMDERLPLGDRTISVLLSPVYTGERFLGTVSVFRDVTREVEAERSKSEFVANVSHEFRTPLTSIKGYNDLLLMGAFGQIDDTQRGMLGTIRDNVTRLAALVEAVLNISKIDSGRERLAVEMVDLDTVVSQVIDHLWALPQHQGKTLTVNFQPVNDLPLIQADPDKLTQIINNVIDNAFNYTPAGGTIDIELQPMDDRERVTIKVADSGVGIPEEFHQSVWERFKRHDDTAVTMDVAGTGLGLSITRELVEMHHGEVWFESSVGKGTTFYVTLPYRQPDYVLSNAQTSTSASD